MSFDVAFNGFGEVFFPRGLIELFHDLTAFGVLLESNTVFIQSDDLSIDLQRGRVRLHLRNRGQDELKNVLIDENIIHTFIGEH